MLNSDAKVRITANAVTGNEFDFVGGLFRERMARIGVNGDDVRWHVLVRPNVMFRAKPALYAGYRSIYWTYKTG